MKLSSFIHFASFGVKTILFRKKEPILGTVIVTDKCNLKCKHCSVNNITAVVHPYEKVRKEMQTLYELGVRILFFCGGETFLWRDGEKTLRDLVIEAKQMGFLIVNVVTNGTFPIDLPEADLILLSLDGLPARRAFLNALEKGISLFSGSLSSSLYPVNIGSLSGLCISQPLVSPSISKPEKLNILLHSSSVEGFMMKIFSDGWESI